VSAALPASMCSRVGGRHPCSLETRVAADELYQESRLQGPWGGAGRIPRRDEGPRATLFDGVSPFNGETAIVHLGDAGPAHPSAGPSWRGRGLDPFRAPRNLSQSVDRGAQAPERSPGVLRVSISACGSSGAPKSGLLRFVSAFCRPR
jgi:hypothetical protein